jgi:squalene synthase HpnC
MSSGVPTTAEVMRQARDENFPVAFRFLPPRLRRHLNAIYAYARLVDDLGDEYQGDREAALAEIEADLDRIYAGEEPRNPTLAPIARTVRTFDVPREPLQRLIEANRVDQRRNWYQTYEELLQYCELSANPVGRLVLYVLGAATPERLELSDNVCTALQLIEFWQDVSEDFHRDRVYIPFDDLQLYSVTEEDLAEKTETLTTVRTLLYFEARRARQLLEDGAPLVHTLSGWGKLAVAGYVGGGFATLDALDRAEYAVIPVGPKATRAEKLKAAWRVLREEPEE